ncbi:MAG: phosphoenolpyruvate--protein phosphotransferase [Sphingomonadales bacterium]
MTLTSRPRLLLRRLHKVMAGPEEGQARLNSVVKEIAATMVAEVCSVYLLNADRALELYGTEGLRQEAVHKTRFKIGHGLVGLIVEEGIPVNLAEASDHPSFVYRPETGEEKYHSLMGVPIIKGGKVVGALVVQNTKRRLYNEEEVEALQTVAMVIAELLVTGELLKPGDLGERLTDFSQPLYLDGQPFSNGLAIGRAVFHEPKIEITHFVSEDITVERLRLHDAFDVMRNQLDHLIASVEVGNNNEHREILETYKMFAYDKGWHARILELVESGLTSEAAVERIQGEIQTRMMKTKDPYLKERLSDLEDLSNRLIRVLMGFLGEDEHEKLQENSIIIAKSMGPAELLDYDRTLLKGIILEEGSPTAHVTIVARAIGIPVLGRVKDVLDLIESGNRVIVDAKSSKAIARPSDEIAQVYKESLEQQQSLILEYEAQKNLPSKTQDEVDIDIYINAGLILDLPNLDATGAKGIGLFRTEFQFMVSSTLPKSKAQKEIYNQVFKSASGRPVIFRTLDVGGDKVVPFLPRQKEENPALGLRAIRMALDRPSLLSYQVRALVGVSQGQDLKIMFPMVTELSEFRAAKKIVNYELARIKKMGQGLPKSVEVGCMLEVPALAWQLPELLKEVDFLSIGTNDLMQFFFASDRTNPKLSNKYDFLSPAALSLMKFIVSQANAAKVPVTICGEHGGNPLEALALMGIGFKRFSVNPSAVGPIRMMVRKANISKLESFISPLLGSPKSSIREDIINFSKENLIPL